MITISFVNFAALEATEDKHVNADENSIVTTASMMRLIVELLSMTFVPP
jgi:putative Ca2+/H+ antiporter (TMEM165/GDT1 family)